MAKQPKDAPEGATPAMPASITADARPEDVATLQAQIEDLKGKLAAADEARSEADKRVLAAAEAQGMLLQTQRPDIPTGKTVEVTVCTGYEVVGYKDNGSDILKPKWGKKTVPTFMHRIDMPAVGGEHMMVGGRQFFHGMVYPIDLDTLRVVKEIEYRLWDHDRNINGSNENAYRQRREDRI